MADGNLAPKAAKDVLIKNLSRQSHPAVDPDPLSIGGGYTGAFLPPVLEGKQAEKRKPGHVHPWSVNPKYSTGLMPKPVQNSSALKGYYSPSAQANQRLVSGPTWPEPHPRCTSALLLL
jgi:hypothetical protein